MRVGKLEARNAVRQPHHLLGDAFAKMRDYAMRSVANETSMNQAAAVVSELTMEPRKVPCRQLNA